MSGAMRERAAPLSQLESSFTGASLIIRILSARRSKKHTYYHELQRCALTVPMFANFPISTDEKTWLKVSASGT